MSTYYSGQRPDGYYPMNKEGAIILGIGGDNSNSGQGTFYEGVMTSGILRMTRKMKSRPTWLLQATPHRIQPTKEISFMRNGLNYLACST